MSDETDPIKIMRVLQDLLNMKKKYLGDKSASVISKKESEAATQMPDEFKRSCH